MSDILENLTAQIGKAIDQCIRPLFKPGARFTVMVRFTDTDTADVIVSDDTDEGMRAIVERRTNGNMPPAQEDQLDAAAAEIARLRSESATQSERLDALKAEKDELQALCDKLAGLLSRTAVALRGPEPPLTRWSWHDLPERAQAAIAAIDLMGRIAKNLAQDAPDSAKRIAELESANAALAYEVQKLKVAKELKWIPDEAQIDAYLADYAMECDDGTYTPTERELFIVKDAVIRLLADCEINAVTETNQRIAELAEAKKDAERLKIELRVSEDALQRALRIFEVSLDDCCADTGTIIPSKVEHLAIEAKIRIKRRPDPAAGAPRPQGHNPQG